MAGTLPLLATDELVAIAWISSITGLSPDIVATQLPAPARKDGTPADWVSAPPFGFVVVSAVGGNPDESLPVNRPVIQVDCWATKPGSNKPPWGRANRIAQAIVAATQDRVTIPRHLTLNANGVIYPPAVVQGAKVMTTPRRTFDDVGDFARYQLDLWLQWIQLDMVTN
jgi:hypothetical protein